MSDVIPAVDWAQRRWEPLEAADLTPEYKAAAESAGGTAEQEVWLNDEYQVLVRHMTPEGRKGPCHLSIKRRDKRPARDWRDLQAIKNELLGPEREAIELFPAESRLVDQADQTHLWAMAEGEMLPVGFQEKEVFGDLQRRKTLRELGLPGERSGSQRDWRPGIPTGLGLGGSEGDDV